MSKTTGRIRSYDPNKINEKCAYLKGDATLIAGDLFYGRAGNSPSVHQTPQFLRNKLIFFQWTYPIEKHQNYPKTLRVNM